MYNVNYVFSVFAKKSIPKFLQTFVKKEEVDKLLIEARDEFNSENQKGGLGTTLIPNMKRILNDDSILAFALPYQETCRERVVGGLKIAYTNSEFVRSAGYGIYTSIICKGDMDLATGKFLKANEKLVPNFSAIIATILHTSHVVIEVTKDNEIVLTFYVVYGLSPIAVSAALELIRAVSTFQFITETFGYMTNSISLAHFLVAKSNEIHEVSTEKFGISMEPLLTITLAAFMISPFHAFSIGVPVNGPLNFTMSSHFPIEGWKQFKTSVLTTEETRKKADNWLTSRAGCLYKYA